MPTALALRAAFAAACRVAATLSSQGPALQVIRGARILNSTGDGWIENHQIVVSDGRIDSIQPTNELAVPPDTTKIVLDGGYVIPGLIDLHLHLLLHPYNEASWNDQVLVESLERRTIRATVHARRTLRAGFTTLRELGTEGAAFADVALRDAIRDGEIPGPRIFAATRALVATGCYGPSGFDPRHDLPKGAQVADGPLALRIAVRQQIAAGADWIKVYADYRRQPGAPSTPTFSQPELDAIVDEARLAGVPVAVHASTPEAIRRAVLAGVKTIEHGYQATAEVFELMRNRGVVLCPTLAANEAIVRYRGTNPAAARRLNLGRALMKRALAAGVTIACGSDVGVFAHGDNARELELLVDFGMTPEAALRAATATAASVLGRDDLGIITPGAIADFVMLAEDPLQTPTALRSPQLVVQAGRIVVD